MSQEGSRLIYAVILAGGTSKRFGKTLPKQFVQVGKKALLLWSVSTFLEVVEIAKIVIVLPEEWFEFGKHLVLSNVRTDKLQFVSGGGTRTKSLLRALHFVQENYGLKDEDMAVTHDAARPFVRKEHIVRSIELCEKASAATLALPATDTVGVSDGEKLVGLTERSRTFMVQTPQTFRIKVFLELYERLTEDQRASLTDATGVFILNGQPVAIVEGDPTNIKVTTEFDLTIAETIAELLSK